MKDACENKFVPPSIL